MNFCFFHLYLTLFFYYEAFIFYFDELVLNRLKIMTRLKSFSKLL